MLHAFILLCERESELGGKGKKLFLARLRGPSVHLKLSPTPEHETQLDQAASAADVRHPNL